MPRISMIRKLRIAGGLVIVGLLVELISLYWNNPLAFMLFLSLGGGLVALGILFFLWSLVSAPDQKSS